MEVIHCGVYDPSYLNIQDYEKDWQIVADDVIYHLNSSRKFKIYAFE